MKSMQQNITIDGERIYLRELKEEDALKKYCRWINDPKVNKFLETKKLQLKN